MASTPRTANVCWPAASAAKAAGDLHSVNAAPSSEHSKVAPCSDEKPKLVCAVEVEPSAGPESIWVSGAVASIVQLLVAGDGSTLPTASIAWTLNECGPS